MSSCNSIITRRGGDVDFRAAQQAISGTMFQAIWRAEHTFPVEDDPWPAGRACQNGHVWGQTRRFGNVVEIATLGGGRFRYFPGYRRIVTTVDRQDDLTAVCRAWDELFEQIRVAE